MKRVATLIFSAVLFLSVMQSCQKAGSDRTSKSIVIDTTLTSGTAYQLDLQPYGDQDDTAAIRKQAVNYTVSEITNTPGTFSPVYHYSALGSSKEPVTDQVVLTVAEGHHNSNGNFQPHSDSTVITINFTIQ